jgi:hypothetical protein
MQRLRMTYDLCHAVGQWQANIPKGHSRKAPFILFMFTVPLQDRLISVKFVIGDYYEIYGENPNLIKSGQKYRTLCAKT